ncbi:S66 peptidase family protein [Phytopseudomonas dryadis]|uniref:LD-carboxypeptidase n=1 Tax=Phytopseudomonas dryadis TaxID=2487520 RepID=A0A4Q9RAF2_9GAMM|nr:MULTISPECIES: LD-carboxypeptidase [Pseudomonas]TBU97134.1 LD-carboxypeptidase [Pseudomonas dryadis]TBV08524.1 LD-carboxypeptidase [Pseudomonas dryadis]TBV18893.1 LD-carboxypeptidase [Pseudomonas sp. FRB 230]
MSQPFAGRLALIAPAAAIAEDVLEATLAQLEVLGIDYHLGAHVRARHRYLAGTPAQRLADLHQAFGLADIEAVWCLRGGYGCAHLLPGIDWALLRRASARPLIGFSDLSILLAAFQRHGLPAIHGPVATALGRQPLSAPTGQRERLASLQALWQLLQGHGRPLPVRHIAGPTRPVDGPLVGGNLTALASACGTLGQLQLPDNAILILEDVGEPYYRLERSFWQLFESFGERRPAAVCLGSFSDCPRRGVQHSIEAIIGEYLAPFAIPLYGDLPSGHGDANLAWPYGHPARLRGSTLDW